ncbi:MAG: NADH-quinone oxidoreductase subunit L, partial [Candidatus Hydrogenedentes bacterium]|nr:NADH-quinone oxidoreductase subunit L [Candidatus Hydrogenedentota bacterium]
MAGASGWMMQHAWLIPALPLLSFAFVGLFVSSVSKRAAGIVATLSIVTSAICAYILAWEYFTLYPPGGEHPALVPWSYEWLRYQPGLSVNVGVLVDPISVLLLIVVTTVSSLVHIYSNAYMHGEHGFGRYFTFLNLFTFSMLGLVVAPDIIQMYV